MQTLASLVVASLRRSELFLVPGNRSGGAMKASDV
jgi:hypothetical protein